MNILRVSVVVILVKWSRFRLLLSLFHSGGMVFTVEVGFGDKSTNIIEHHSLY